MTAPLLSIRGLEAAYGRVTALKGIDPDVMTPREALEALYRLKSLADG